MTSIHEIASTFKEGTQITNREEAKKAGREADHLLLLIAVAKLDGATPYEIECAMKGEFF